MGQGRIIGTVTVVPGGDLQVGQKQPAGCSGLAVQGLKLRNGRGRNPVSGPFLGVPGPNMCPMIGATGPLRAGAFGGSPPRMREDHGITPVVCNPFPPFKLGGCVD